MKIHCIWKKILAPDVPEKYATDKETTSLCKIGVLANKFLKVFVYLRAKILQKRSPRKDCQE
jgi:hypothetical protein